MVNIGKRYVEALTVIRGAPRKPARLRVGTDLGVPDHLSSVGVEEPEDAALLGHGHDIARFAIDGEGEELRRATRKRPVKIIGGGRTVAHPGRFSRGLGRKWKRRIRLL